MTRIQAQLEAQNALASAQACLNAAIAALANVNARPLDQFISTTDGLDVFVNTDGTVKNNYNIIVAGWPSNFGQGQSLLNAIGAQPFPQSRGPATVVTDGASRLQFQTDGTEILPNAITLYILHYGEETTEVLDPVTLEWIAVEDAP